MTDLKLIPLDSRHMGDFERLLSRREFHGCYCAVWSNHDDQWEDRCASRSHENLEHMRGRVRRGEKVGFLVSREIDGAVVAWIGAGPKTSFPLLKDLPGSRLGPFEESVWSIGCMAIAFQYRSLGYSKKIVELAVEEARRAEAASIEAYPIEPAEEGCAYRGTRKMYEAAGFQVVDEEPVEGEDITPPAEKPAPEPPKEEPVEEPAEEPAAEEKPAEEASVPEAEEDPAAEETGDSPAAIMAKVAQISEKAAEPEESKPEAEKPEPEADAAPEEPKPEVEESKPEVEEPKPETEAAPEEPKPEAEESKPEAEAAPEESKPEVEDPAPEAEAAPEESTPEADEPKPEAEAAPAGEAKPEAAPEAASSEEPRPDAEKPGDEPKPQSLGAASAEGSSSRRVLRMELKLV